MIELWRNASDAPFEVLRSDGRRVFVNPRVIAFIASDKGSKTSGAPMVARR